MFGDRLVRGYPLIYSACAHSQLSPYGPVANPGEGPPYFYTKLMLEGLKKNFCETPFPLPVGLDLPLQTPLQDYVGSCLFSVILP